MGCASSTNVATTVVGPGVGQGATEEAQQIGVQRAGSFYEHYSLGAKLGAGAFAQVRIALPANADHSDSAFCNRAVKIIDLRQNKQTPPGQRQPGDDEVDKRIMWEAKAELAVWKKASEGAGEYCIRLHEIFWDATCCYLVMERCDSTLLDELQCNVMTEYTLGKLFHQMVQALECLHRAEIVHRDVKPDNFLVNRGHQVKLGDFGLSATFVPGQSLKQVYGTAPFMSPEMLKYGRYDEKTDVWSFGVMMYALMFGNFPYFAQEKSSKAMKLAIRQGTPAPSYKPWVKPGTPETGVCKPSSDCEKLIRSLLEREPASRPSAREILEDPFWAKLRQPGFAEVCPSLRPMLSGALRAGAFSAVRNKEKAKDGTDMLLSELSKKSARLKSMSSSNATPESSRSTKVSSSVWSWQGKKNNISSPASSADISRQSTSASFGSDLFGAVRSGAH